MGARRIAVVGDGIIGWSIAFELSRRGAPVAIFAPRLDGAATHASAGILAPYTEAHEGSGLLALARRGLEAYDGFVALVRSASDIPFEYRRSGTLEVAEDEAMARGLRSRTSAAWARDAGLEWIDGADLRREVPYVTARAAGALVCPTHGFVAVPDFVAALASAASQAGVLTRPLAVQGISPREGGVTVTTAEGGEPFASVVLCAGAWTAALDPFAPTVSPVRPIRGQLVRLRSDFVQPSSVLWGRDCYIVPWRDGTLLVGATVEDAGFDVRATAAGVRGLLDAAVRLVPDLSGATFLDVRVGLRPARSSELPLLGPGPDPRVVYATGHFRNGVLLAPLTAQLIADYVLESKLDPVFSAP